MEQPSLAKLADALTGEFAPEIYSIEARLEDADSSRKPVLRIAPGLTRLEFNGLKWQPCYEYLSVRFSYGQGVDATLVEKVKRVISDYADEKLKADATKGEAVVPK